MKHALIEEDNQTDFEERLDILSAKFNVHGVQYHPVVVGGKIWYTALVFYKEEI